LLCNVFKYTKRTSFLTSISLAQISEFSLIIISQGIVFGHVSQELASITIILAAITIGLTSYFIKFDSLLYMKFFQRFNLFHTTHTKENDLEYKPDELEKEVLLIGYDRLGYSIFKTLQKLQKEFLVIDYNPDIIKRLIKHKVHCIYGDIGDVDLIHRLNFKKVELVICTVPDIQTNLLILKKIKHFNKNVRVFLTAHVIDEALDLYDLGADYVILPHFLGGDHVAYLIEDMHRDIGGLIKTKVNHIIDLRNRKEIGHAHPGHHHAKKHN